MDQQYCLRWNNYHDTVKTVFHKLYSAQKFTDVSLAVGGKTFQCHKVVLSACSSYFEQLLTDHGTHHHPLLLFHDVNPRILEALITFMYLGEVNVHHDDLATVLKVADTFKIKGLADSATNFARGRIHPSMPQPEMWNGNPFPNISAVKESQANNVPRSRPINLQNLQMPNQYSKCEELMHAAALARQQLIANSAGKRPQNFTNTNPKPYKKRCQVKDEMATALPLSPPTSLNESPQSDVPQPSPEAHVNDMDLKHETGEETDGELQIDESAGQTPSEGTDSDAQSLRGSSEANSPEPADVEPKSSELKPYEGENLSQSPTENPNWSFNSNPSPGPFPNPTANTNSNTNSASNCSTAHKCCERQYTTKDLDDGIECVISGELKPAQAIQKYRIPRRTFFRRLSKERQKRGIQSVKELAADQYFKNQFKKLNMVNQASTPNQKSCYILPAASVVSSDDQQAQYPSIRIKEEKSLKGDTDDLDKKIEAADPNTYINLLNLSPSYEAYINYLKILSKNHPDNKVDDNFNMADLPEKALSLVTYGTNSSN